MFDIRLAELNIRIDNKYPYIEKMCRDYIISGEECDFSVSATTEEMEREANEECNALPYLETLAVYRKIAEKLLEYNGFLLHGVVLETAGQGIAFCARSGTGKSTHVFLWKKLLGDKCEIINGDKPLVRIIDGEVYAYGTPWCGKEGIQKNAKTLLRSLCFIERGKENKLTKLPQNEVFPRLMTQIYMPKDNGAKMLKTLEMADEFVKKTSSYVMKCNMDISAAEVAYKGIVK